MIKRSSVSTADTAQDISMSRVDRSALKKAKVDLLQSFQENYAYPKDYYTIQSTFLENSRFEILYMATRGRAEVPRLLLEYVGASYTSAAPVDWPAGKKETPFGVLPVLTHYKSDGTAFTLPELPAQVRYLARLFGLIGETLEEDAILDACFQSAVDNVLNIMLMEVWRKPDPKAEGIIDNAFEKLTAAFDGFEKYLSQNGSNGYLLKEKTTYAEFPWYDWLDHFFEAYPEHMKSFVSETVRPATYKLFKRFESNPRLKAYIAGGRWEYRTATPLIGLYSTGVIVSDWELAYEFYHDKLGLQCVMNVQPEHVGEGGRYIEFLVNEQERTRFTVYCHGKTDTSCPKHTANISFSVRSVRETYDRLVKMGIKFKMPPQDTPWGTMAQLEDPDGNALTINGPINAVSK
ncbi:hypothetical protein EDD11_005558 [Mortierella claussenii]|nr:hypothetical protein EDD11_005558 [Mortierella claussenii]